MQLREIGVRGVAVDAGKLLAGDLFHPSLLVQFILNAGSLLPFFCLKARRGEVDGGEDVKICSLRPTVRRRPPLALPFFM